MRAWRPRNSGLRVTARTWRRSRPGRAGGCRGRPGAVEEECVQRDRDQPQQRREDQEGAAPADGGGEARGERGENCGGKTGHERQRGQRADPVAAVPAADHSESRLVEDGGLGRSGQQPRSGEQRQVRGQAGQHERHNTNQRATDHQGPRPGAVQDPAHRDAGEGGHQQPGGKRSGDEDGIPAGVLADGPHGGGQGVVEQAPPCGLGDAQRHQPAPGSPGGRPRRRPGGGQAQSAERPWASRWGTRPARARGCRSSLPPSPGQDRRKRPGCRSWCRHRRSRRRFPGVRAGRCPRPRGPRPGRPRRSAPARSRWPAGTWAPGRRISSPRCRSPCPGAPAAWRRAAPRCRRSGIPGRSADPVHAGPRRPGPAPAGVPAGCPGPGGSRCRAPRRRPPGCGRRRS